MEPVPVLPSSTRPDAVRWPGVIAAYRDRMPVAPGVEIVTLGEGNTPLLELKHVSELVGAQVFAKCEGQNPTGSFKDRGMTVAVTNAKASGASLVVCASTGNTSASASAYAARAGLRAGVVLPAGQVAAGKLGQAVMYGGRIVQVSGNFDAALLVVRELAARPEVCVVNSINPDRIAGQRSAAYEVASQLGESPDMHFLPVGNAGNISAYWAGYVEMFESGERRVLPRMCGIQAAGAAPFVAGGPIAHPETIATAIRIGAPASWDQALLAREASDGLFAAVSDEDILAAYHLLASTEGVFCEPASAASVAGLLAQARVGGVPEGSIVVCTLTGHGLKDPDRAVAEMEEPVVVEPSLAAVLAVLEA